MIEHVVALVREAGAAAMEVYRTDFEAQLKADKSPVTEADLRSHRILVDGLREQFPSIPVLSEESSRVAPYVERSRWGEFWLVDPLDGTKEFLKRNGQFTVNVALVRDGRPVAGVVYAPASELLYYSTLEGEGFQAKGDAPPAKLAQRRPPEGDTLVVVGSLSHPTPEMERFLVQQRNRYPHVKFRPMGSSLKICMVADGCADIYPRFGPTMEWDTAAAHAVANAAGCIVRRHDSDEELRYNKEDLHNPWFVVAPVA